MGEPPRKVAYMSVHQDFEELIHRAEQDEKDMAEVIELLHRAEEKLAAPDTISRMFRVKGYFGHDDVDTLQTRDESVIQ
jgi:hypothetical protein